MRPPLPSLEETYGHDDKIPFGGYVTFQKILDGFDNVKIVYGADEVIDSDMEVHRKADKHSLYFIITDRLYMPGNEVDWAIEYVTKGNELFISANQINNEFLRKLRLNTNQSLAFIEDQWGQMRDTKVSIYFGQDLPQVPFQFYYYPFNNYFRDYPKTNARVLGVNDQGEPDFIVLFMGEGRLYLHLAPRALGNYFLLTEKNIDYLNHVLNYFDTDPVVVYWDEYYNQKSPARSRDKTKEEGDFSSLGVIMHNPFLKWAFLVAATGLLFFIFSNMKRKQRIIQTQEQPVNATVDFVETVGRLYFINKDNKNIASKLITYFYENVRSKYFLKNTGDMDSFVLRLAGKKGMKEDKVRELLNCINDIENNEAVSDVQLLHLNQLLEQFYKHK